MAIPQGRKRRTFRVVSRQLQQQLAAQFTVLAACSETSIEDWSLLAVTPFSHWLSQAEFNAVFEQGGDDTCWLHFASLKTMEPLLARIRKQGMHLLSPA